MTDARSNLSRKDFLKLVGTFVATSATAAACAPDSVPSPGPTQAVAPVLPTGVPPELTQSVPPVSLGIIALNRMAFGPRPGDLEAFNTLGSTDEERLRAYVAQQLIPESVDDGEFEERYTAAGFETLHKTQDELYFDHIANNQYDSNDDAYWQWYSKPAYELVDATFLRAVYSRKQLVEVLADFWHNHFNVYFWQDDGVPLLVSYNRDVLRAHMLGNFRQMLEAVATHPSMLYYLNQNNSSDAGPNENFARELFELHTLGAENYLGVRDPNTVEKDANGIAIGYVDNDVYESARALTGWRIDDDIYEYEDGIEKTGRFIYYKPWHDRFNKLILGKYIPADQPDMQDGRDVLDLLAYHPGTARYISRKLARRFIDIVIHIANRNSVRILLDCIRIPHPQVILGPQRMQLEQLTREVLIGTRIRTIILVQVIQHGGVGRHRFEHLTEIPQHVRSQHIAVIRNKQRHAIVLPEINIEMVVPEIGEHFDKLFFAVHSAQECRIH